VIRTTDIPAIIRIEDGNEWLSKGEGIREAVSTGAAGGGGTRLRHSLPPFSQYNILGIFIALLDGMVT